MERSNCLFSDFILIFSFHEIHAWQIYLIFPVSPQAAGKAAIQIQKSNTTPLFIGLPPSFSMTVKISPHNGK